MLHHHINEEWILRVGRLLQQFIVDAYACTEHNRLKFICENQRQLRSDLYNGLQDALNVGNILGNDVRQKMILLSSFKAVSVPWANFTKMQWPGFANLVS
jgi:hypothetical protein